MGDDGRITDRAPGPDPWGSKPPWELPGSVRRDCLPHRGPLLARLGAQAIAASLLAFALWCVGVGILCLPIGLALGLATWAMAGYDLVRMRRGLTDRRGEAQTREARRLGRLAVCLSLVGGVFAVWWFLALFRY
jgi:hypothetical protein